MWTPKVMHLTLNIKTWINTDKKEMKWFGNMRFVPDLIYNMNWKCVTVHYTTQVHSMRLSASCFHFPQLKCTCERWMTHEYWATVIQTLREKGLWWRIYWIFAVYYSVQPCNGWTTNPGSTLPLPNSGWDRLQHPMTPKGGKMDGWMDDKSVRIQVYFQMSF